MACGDLHDLLGPRFLCPGGHWRELWSLALQHVMQHVMQLNQLMQLRAAAYRLKSESRQPRPETHTVRTQKTCSSSQPETSSSIQKRHPYTGSLNLEMSGKMQAWVCWSGLVVLIQNQAPKALCLPKIPGM